MVEHRAIEKKWQEKWAKARAFNVEKSDKPKYYVLEMFPYPSGTGLHMGHAFNYTIGDIFARYKRLKGFNVLHPMGFDSLGLPAENAAIKAGTAPSEYTEAAIENFIEQQKALGVTYDWDRVVNTSSPDYYKWDQWIFIQMFKKGLAYKKQSPVNWCPKCETVLANEQVQNGVCWRHEDTKVDVKNLNQWYFKITDYADELNNMDELSEWPDRITKLQKNWIGNSLGSEVIFSVNGVDWPVFTTRPDTLMGVTFVVISAQHSRLMSIVTDEKKAEVEKFVSKQSSVSQEDIDKLEKEGVFTGAYAKHPITGVDVPIYAGNFVLADYGSGMVMAVPAHDQRDYEFATKYDVEIKQVVSGEMDGRALLTPGKLINSGEFDGLDSVEAKEVITKKLEEISKGSSKVNYRLRDWLVSRQRYWGTPIPIIYCDKCGEVADENLPVKLPTDVTFGKGNPMETSSNFVDCKCPTCGSDAKRETDTMDTFVNSSWYYLRYTDPKNTGEIFDKDKANYWSPVDMYIGGAEHACMHLIYIRFYTKFLRDIGLLKFNEPAVRMFNQGLLHAQDGRKMSKSLGNVINPLDIIEKSGADPLRLFLVSVASPDSDFSWSDKGFLSSLKFLQKVNDYFDSVTVGNSSDFVLHKINLGVREIEEDIVNLKYNLAAIKLRMLFDSLDDEVSKDTLEKFLKLLSPFCPHFAEELWGKIGNVELLSLNSWPDVVGSKINMKLEEHAAYGSDLLEDIRTAKELAKLEKLSKITLISSASWKYDLYALIGKSLDAGERDFKQIIGKVMATDLKQHGKQVTKMIPGLLKKGVSNISFEDEKRLIMQAKTLVEGEFGCDVVIEQADSSEQAKAKVASPGKPAIVLE